MMCPKCHSENVTVQIVTETQLKKKHRSISWWVLIGWWWVPIKWICFFWLALLAKIFAPKRQKLTQKHVPTFVCHSCGHTWAAK